MALAPIDFPNDPDYGYSFEASNGITYTWLGNRWRTNVGSVDINVNPEDITFNTLADVSVANPTSDDIVYWNNQNSLWEAKQLSEWLPNQTNIVYSDQNTNITGEFNFVTNPLLDLTQLHDVTVTEPQIGDTIKWSGEAGGWVNGPACENSGGGGGGGITDAPVDGKIYGRKDADWTEVTGDGVGKEYQAGYGLQLKENINEFSIDTNIVRTTDNDDYVNVLDFLPANTAPSDVTDWVDIFQAAIDSGTRQVLVPDLGFDYQVSKSIQIKDKYGFNFVSNGHVVIKPTADHIESGGDNTAAVKLLRVFNSEHVHITGFYFTGARDAGLTGKAQLVLFQKCSNVVIEECELYNNEGMGCAFVDNSDNKGRGLVVTRCRFYNLGYAPNQSIESRLAALVFSPAAGTLRNIVVSECSFLNIGLDAISLGGVVNARVTDCVCENNHAGMIYTNNAKNVIIKGCVVRDSGGTGIDISNSEEVIVSNNTVYDCSSCGIGIFATDAVPGNPYTFSVNVSDNICYNNHTQAKAQFGENDFAGGINITAVGAGQFRRIAITGNVCYDDHNPEDITQNWAIGCGNNRVDQDKFLEVRIDESNILESYVGNGTQDSSNDIQSPAVGIQPYGDIYRINNNTSVQLGFVTRGFNQLSFYETDGSQDAIIMIRYNQETAKFMNANGTNNTKWSVTDQAGRMCVVQGPFETINGSQVKRVTLINRTGDDNFVYVKGMLT